MLLSIYNGKTVPANNACIQHSDRGFTLGHGLFETIFVNKGAFPMLDYHWQRLEQSAPLIGINLPFSRQAFEAMLDVLIHENDLQHKVAVARVTLTHGDSDRGLLPLISPSPNFVMSVFEYSYVPKMDFSARIVSTKKNEHAVSARVKSTSYLDNILAKQEAISHGYDEAILLNTTLHVADGAITNIFMVKNEQIYTPRIADGALPGVVRTMLLTEQKDAFPIIEKSILPDELLSADEVFLTNALMGVQPVSRLNNTKYQACSISLALAKKLREMISTDMV